jgi:hypothetical protein
LRLSPVLDASVSKFICREPTQAAEIGVYFLSLWKKYQI